MSQHRQDLDSTLNFSPLTVASQNEEQKISQNSIASLINDYEKQRENAVNESHQTIRSILKLFGPLENQEGNVKKRKSHEADIETTLKENPLSLKKLKTSSPNLNLNLNLNLNNFNFNNKQTQ